MPSGPGYEASSQAKPSRHPEVACSRRAIGLPMPVRAAIDAFLDIRKVKANPNTARAYTAYR